MRDSLGRRPVDMTEEIHNPRLKQELVTLLVISIRKLIKLYSQDKGVTALYLMWSSLCRSWRGVGRLFPFTCRWWLSVSCHWPSSCFLVTNRYNNPFIDILNQYWTLIMTSFFFFVNTFFCLCWLRNPGYLQKSQKVRFLKLVEKFDPNMLCPTCEVICSSESRHCYVCNKCVERFDHHCQWINNCVGLK